MVLPLERQATIQRAAVSAGGSVQSPLGRLARTARLPVCFRAVAAAALATRPARPPFLPGLFQGLIARFACVWSFLYQSLRPLGACAVVIQRYQIINLSYLGLTVLLKTTCPMGGG